MATTAKTKKTPKLDGLDLARMCAHYADEKKAEDIAILDVSGLSPITDYVVVCTATSSPHLRAVRDEVSERLKEDHSKPALVSDGSLDSQWLVLGYPNVIVHVFTREKREFYAMEELWNDAPRVPLKK
jgi:ribosome-associated protein